MTANLPEPVREALDALSLLANFAYENGYHELGYDPVEKTRQYLAALAQQAEELARDAARYRWLRDTQSEKWTDAATGTVFTCSIDFGGSGHDIDAAIDAAMQEQQP